MNKYYFVIDTDQYAGNFERDMCAFITGQLGDCGVGDEMADIAKEQLGNKIKFFEDFLGYESDEDGSCLRPCKIMSSPNNKGHNSVAIYFIKEPDKETIDLMKQRAEVFGETNKQQIKILGFRWITERTTVTEEKIEI